MLDKGLYKRPYVGVISTVLIERLNKIGPYDKQTANVDLNIMLHAWSRNLTLMIFLIEVTPIGGETINGYFLLKKTNAQMMQILEEGERIISNDDDEVDLIMGLDDEGGVAV
jgi:hypothetical protein